MRSFPNPIGSVTAFALASLVWMASTAAEVGVGERAPLFVSLDENMQEVDMADFIDGRPLVLAVGSAS